VLKLIFNNKTKVMKKTMVTIVCTLMISFASLSSFAQTEKGAAIIDNSKIKVTEYTSMPGKDVCGSGRHSHAAHLTVVLNAATVKIITADGKATEQKVPAGATFWSEAETHTVINNGKEQVKIYIIEVK
jgi:hypothetical protein